MTKTQKFPDHDKLLWMYRTMVSIRAFEEKYAELANAGKPVGLGHSSVGQEAVPTGICANLTERDYLGSTHRGHGHCIAKGVDPKRMMAELWGKSTGTNKGKGGSMHIADFSKGMLGANGIVGSNLPLTVGAALSAKVQKTDQVAVSFFGDGAANIGAFHEALNLAAIWKLPAIFVCENNLYAESTPVEYSMAIKNIADRAVAYGIPGVVADGQDVFDVYWKAGEAIARARRGEGPTLLECKTYRYYGHYLADDHFKYRTKEEVEYYKSRDCIVRFKKVVLENELLTPQELENVVHQVAVVIEEAAKYGEQSPYPSLDELCTDVYVKYK